LTSGKSLQATSTKELAVYWQALFHLNDFANIKNQQLNETQDINHHIP
jgi:hypothetical protein